MKRHIISCFLKNVSLVLIGYVICWFNISLTLPVIAIGTIIWYETTSDKSRRIAAKYRATSMKKEDVLRIVEELPSWVTFPDRERAEWLNEIILQLWPSLNNCVVKYCRGALQTKIKKKFESFRFEDIDFGTLPPKIDGVKVYKPKASKDSVIIDFDVFYDGDCDVHFSMSGAQIGRIRDFQLGVEMRIVLKPILVKFPLVGGIQIFFLNTPDINFELEGISGIPGFSSFVRQKIEERISKKIVFPNKITKRFTKSVEAAELKSLEPEGVLRVHVFEAKDLEKKDVTGKSDPYVILRIGAQEYKTQVIKRNLNPKWDYWCEFIIIDPVAQQLFFQLFDQDEFNEDDFMGSGVIEIHNVIKEFENDRWFKLDNAKHGQIHFRFTWLALSSELSSLHAASEETRLLKVSNINTGLLMIYIDSAHNLPKIKFYKNPDPYLVITVGKNQMKSKVKRHTVDPVWEQGFCILVHDPKNDSLIITIIDKHTDTKIDEFIYSINELFEKPQLHISKEEFVLQNDSNCKLTLSLQLRILNNALYEAEVSDSDSEDEFVRKHSRTSLRSQKASQESSLPEKASPTVDRKSGSIEETLTKSVSTHNVAVPSINTQEIIKSPSFKLKPDVFGRIEISLQFSELRQKLMVKIHKVANLPLKDPSHIPDPYVKVRLVSSVTGNSLKNKTKVIVDNCNPVYEETFEYLLSKSELPGYKLIITVKSKKLFNSHIIGQAIIYLRDVDDLEEPHREWYDLIAEEESD